MENDHDDWGTVPGAKGYLAQVSGPEMITFCGSGHAQ